MTRKHVSKAGKVDPGDRVTRLAQGWPSLHVNRPLTDSVRTEYIAQYRRCLETKEVWVGFRQIQYSRLIVNNLYLNIDCRTQDFNILKYYAY